MDDLYDFNEQEDIIDFEMPHKLINEVEVKLEDSMKVWDQL